MKPKKIATACWRTPSIVAALWSLPIWVFLFIDTFVVTEPSTLAPIIFHVPGVTVVALLTYGWVSYEDYSFVAIYATNCIFYFGVVWLIVKLYYRKRKPKQLNGEI